MGEQANKERPRPQGDPVDPPAEAPPTGSKAPVAVTGAALRTLVRSPASRVGMVVPDCGCSVPGRPRSFGVTGWCRIDGCARDRGHGMSQRGHVSGMTGRSHREQGQAHLSAEQPPQGEDAWLPAAHADPGRPGDSGRPPTQGAARADRVTDGATRVRPADQESGLSPGGPQRPPSRAGALGGSCSGRVAAAGRNGNFFRHGPGGVRRE